MEKFGIEILRKLNAAGYAAYFVGGCVRDYLLKKPFKDMDIATNATPDQVMALFEHTIPTGVAYGTVTVKMGGHLFEVTTFRKELDYDGRRPKVIAFSHVLEEDLSRRDFTMNAMAMDANHCIIDPFGGARDLAAGILKFVGEPIKRLEEDHLRVFRFVRFLTTYPLKSFEIEEIARLNLPINNLSAERIREEFNQIILSKEGAKGVILLKKLQLLGQFFEELEACNGVVQKHPAHDKAVFEHTLEVMMRTEPILELRLAALCHDLGKVKTKTTDASGCDHFYGHAAVSKELTLAFMRRLKYSNQQMEWVSILVEQHMRLYENLTKPSARRLIQKIGAEKLPLLFKLQRADTESCLGDRTVFIEQINRMEALCELILEEESALKVSDLEVNGYDLMALGFKGPVIKEKLLHLLEAVIDEKVANDKALLLAYLKRASCE